MTEGLIDERQTWTQEEKEQCARDTELLTEFASNLRNAKELATDMPVSTTGSLEQWSEVRRGAIAAEIELAYKYLMDWNNPEGSFEERRRKLDDLVRRTFSKFVEVRTREYQSVRQHYRGIDWAQPGKKSSKTLECQPEFVFDRLSIRHTQNGDWKAGPIWDANDTKMTWHTGGHRSSDTFAELDAVYANINKRVTQELNSARTILHERGIPTVWP